MAIAIIALAVLLTATSITARPDAFGASSNNQDSDEQQWQWASQEFASRPRGGRRIEGPGSFRGYFYPSPLQHGNDGLRPRLHYPPTRSYPMPMYPLTRSIYWERPIPEPFIQPPPEFGQEQFFGRNQNSDNVVKPRQFSWPYFAPFSVPVPEEALPVTNATAESPKGSRTSRILAHPRIEIARSVELDVDTILNRKWVGGKPLPTYTLFFWRDRTEDDAEREAALLANAALRGKGKIDGVVGSPQGGVMGQGKTEDSKVGATKTSEYSSERGAKTVEDKKADGVAGGNKTEILNGEKDMPKSTPVKTDETKPNETVASESITIESRELPVANLADGGNGTGARLETFDEDDDDEGDDEEDDASKPDVEVMYEDSGDRGNSSSVNRTLPYGIARDPQNGFPIAAGFPLGSGYPIGAPYPVDSQGAQGSGDPLGTGFPLGVVYPAGSFGGSAPPQGPIIRRLIVRHGGVAVAGPGGIATAGPGGVAIVGPGGVAYTRPQGVAVVGPGGKVIALSAGESEPRAGDARAVGGRVVAHGPVVYFHPADA